MEEEIALNKQRLAVEIKTLTEEKAKLEQENMLRISEEKEKCASIEAQMVQAI